MSINRIEELYAELEGKTERIEIEAVLNKATVKTLRLYLKYEGGYKAYEGTNRWKKAKYVEATADLILENIVMKEELNSIREAMKYPLVFVRPESEPPEDMELYSIRPYDDYTEIWRKLDWNFEMIDRCESMTDVRYLLCVSGVRTLSHMMWARGYEMPNEYGECDELTMRSLLANAFVRQEEARRKKLTEYKELKVAYAELREFIRVIRADLKTGKRIVSEHKGDYPNMEIGVMAISEEYRNARLESFRLYLKLKRSKNFLKL